MTVRFVTLRSEHARLAIYDVTGRLVHVLHDGLTGKGLQQFQWGIRNAYQPDLSDGVYFVRLSKGGRTVSQRLVFVNR